MTKSSLEAHAALPLLGIATGLRSFTPLAVASWFAHSGRLPVRGTWAAPLAHPVTVALLTAAAAGEYIGDKLPNTPNRTAPLPLLGRLTLGGLLGAVLATALRRPLAPAIALGTLGAAAGTFGGFQARRSLTQTTGLNDLPVALAGDAAALALSILSLDRLTS